MDHSSNTLNEIFEEIFGSSDENSVIGDGAMQQSSNAMEESNINSDSVQDGPKVGMVFADIDSLYDFYQQHARTKGFSVPKKYASKEKGDYRKFMPAHRHLTPAMKRTLEAQDIAGIRPCKSIRMLEIGAGGPENLSCMRDCRNFIDQRRRFRISDGDVEAVRSLFLKMQEADNNFYYAIDLDNELRLCNVFWVHPRARVAYQEFHDVVSFDTTYLVNRYKMPFATFVGVNHHGQSVLFGCALLSHEIAESFKWLFRTWITAMGGVHPNAILTDQCESMRKAIRDDMPNTVHRFCLWHILCKVPEKFKGVVEYDGAIKEFKALIYDSLSSQMFEENLTNFLVKYGLEGNEWLRKLYLDREYWVPVYLRHIFWAEMLSTQKSESIHAFFDGYINCRSTLKQFVDQYEIAIRAKSEKEFIADFYTKYKVTKCISDFPWEKQFQMVNTMS